MNIGQMTAVDCAGWCAYNDGWVLECGVEGDPVWCKKSDIKKWNPCKEDYPESAQFEHPFPLTMEGARSAIPRYWEVSKEGGVWKAEHTKNTSAPKVFVVTYPDDVTALFRIAVAARSGGRQDKIGVPSIPECSSNKTKGTHMSLPLTAYLRGEVHVCKYCGCSVVNRKCEGCGAADVVQINIDQPPKNLPAYTSGEMIAMGVAKGLCLLVAFFLGMAVWEWMK